MTAEQPTPAEPSAVRRADGVKDALQTGQSAGVSVLVPVLDEIDHVDAMLAGLAAQELDVPVEFLLIDGGSMDGTRERLEAAAREDPRLRVIDNPERRIPSALNRGLAASGGRYVARMDAHTVYPSAYLASGISRLDAGDAQWVSGPALPFGEGVWSRRVALALETSLGVGGATFRRAMTEVETDTGFTGVLHRETLQALGGWDEESLVNEDAELAARLRAAGGRILCVPEMAARYIPRDSLGALRTQYFRYGMFRARTSGLHPHGLRRSNLLPPGLVLTLAAALAAPGALRTVARAGLLAYIAAVLVTSVRVAARGRPGDALALPAVFATMHLAWGAGFIAGCLRFGLPLRAIAHAVSGGRWPRAAASAAAPEPAARS